MGVFDYQTSIISRRRKGTANDPYIDINESQQIVQNKAVLSEIPDSFTKVSVSGLGVTWIETTGIPSENQYKVNYDYGYVEFHSSRNNETLSFSYKGTGAYYLNSKRVFVLVDENGDVTQTLQDFIDLGNNKITEIDNKITEIDNKISETETARQNAITATNNANDAADNANTAAETTQLIFKNPVSTYLQISSTYPTPSIGWTVQTLDDSKYYRWDGSTWVYIQEIQLSQIDTKLSKNGDTMSGNLNMGNNAIQLGSFKIKHNPNLNSIDIEI